MNHDKIKELILLYHDGELGEKDKKEVEEHIVHCPKCQKEFEEMKSIGPRFITGLRGKPAGF